MAKILDQEEQRKALKNIIGSIKEITAANEFLSAQNTSGVYSISFTAEDGKKYATEISASSKQDLDALILVHKEQERTRIEKLAEDNRIALDPEDRTVLDFML